MNTMTTIPHFDTPRASTMTLPRLLHAYLIEAKYEFLRMLRTPGFVVPMLALPVLLYILLGVLIFGESTAKDPQLAIYMFASYVVFAVTTPGMFGFGVGLAMERQSGVLRLKRAQPMPMAANLFAKLAMALAVVAIVLAILIPIATAAGHVSLSLPQLANVVLVSLLSTMTCCAIGFFIGAMVSGSAATGVVNLIYFPMMYLSGMFFPLPKFLAQWAVIWPTFYMDQLVVAAAGGKSFMTTNICVAVLVGLTVLFGGLAIRKLTRRG